MGGWVGGGGGLEAGEGWGVKQEMACAALKSDTEGT